jgi:hypothetical protein
MCRPGRLDRLDLLELRISHVFEQPSAASEQDRDDRDDDLVEQAGCEVLLRDARPESHGEEGGEVNASTPFAVRTKTGWWKGGL